MGRRVAKGLEYCRAALSRTGLAARFSCEPAQHYFTQRMPEARPLSAHRSTVAVTGYFDVNHRVLESKDGVPESKKPGT
jgi:hypothetical protein